MDNAAARASKTPRPECYDKPIWTLEALARVLPGLPRHLRKVAATACGRPISAALRERIMLAVATENRCRYCQAAHREFGAAVGLRQDEMLSILQGRDGTGDEGERAALAFVRDLAKRQFQSRDESLYARLAAHFDDDARTAIEASAHVMNFANRFGNTFDAALVRLRRGCDSRAVPWPDLLFVSAAFAAAAVWVAPVVGGLALLRTVRRRDSEQV